MDASVGDRDWVSHNTKCKSLIMQTLDWQIRKRTESQWGYPAGEGAGLTRAS